MSEVEGGTSTSWSSRARRQPYHARRLALRALRAQRSGTLWYDFADSHQAPSVVSELAYWCAWERRSRLRRDYEERLSVALMDEQTRALLPFIEASQPALIRLSDHERRYGIRWTRAPLYLAIMRGDVEKELRKCYRYSLAFVVLDREELVTSWEGDLAPWLPSE